MTEKGKWQIKKEFQEYKITNRKYSEDIVFKNQTSLQNCLSSTSFEANLKERQVINAKNLQRHSGERYAMFKTTLA